MPRQLTKVGKHINVRFGITRRLQTTEDINQPYHGVWEQIPKRTARTTVPVRIGESCRGLAVALRAFLLEERSFSQPSPRPRAEKRFHSSILRSPTCSRSVAWCSTSRHPAATNSRKRYAMSFVGVASGGMRACFQDESSDVVCFNDSPLGLSRKQGRLRLTNLLEIPITECLRVVTMAKIAEEVDLLLPVGKELGVVSRPE